MSIGELRKDLAAAFRIAWKLGLSEGVSNHFSAIVEGGEERYLINRFGPLWSEINEDDLLLIDGNGAVLEGEGEIEATARYIHIAGHRANSRHKVLLHTHMPHATALTMLEDGELIMAHQNALQFWRRMAWHDYTAEFCETYDQSSFDAHYDSLPIEHFEPMVRRVLARPTWADKNEAVSGFHGQVIDTGAL